MARAKINSKKSSLNGNRSNGTLYLTKRILVSASRKAFAEAAEKTMDTLGYNLVAKDGWLVKIYPDGHCEKLSELESVKKSTGAIFD